jgi:WD40 repeat protein
MSSIRQVAHIDGQRIAGIAWSPSGKLLAIASTSGISLYSIPSDALSHSWGADKPIIVAFRPDGEVLASISADSDNNVVSLWNPETGTLLNTLKADGLIT